jgi:hypothetical protein
MKIIMRILGKITFTLNLGECSKIANAMPLTSLILRHTPEKAKQLPSANILDITAKLVILAQTPQNQQIRTRRTYGLQPPDKKRCCFGALLL